ncbi:general transcription factor IIE subunit 1-like, partial [Trifolium pratense]
RLVKLAARAFYDDLTSKGDNQPKTGRSDNRGIAVVVLDALTSDSSVEISSHIQLQRKENKNNDDNGLEKKIWQRTSNCIQSNFVELSGSLKKKRLSLEIIGEK